MSGKYEGWRSSFPKPTITWGNLCNYEYVCYRYCIRKYPVVKLAVRLCSIFNWTRCPICEYLYSEPTSAEVCAGIAQSVERLATGGAVRGSIPSGGEFFRNRPDRLWDPPSLLHNGYRDFPGGTKAGTWRWPPTPPTPSSFEVKERV